jgi:hypothetical protein
LTARTHAAILMPMHGSDHERAFDMDEGVTSLLAAANVGDSAAEERLFERLYAELRQCAHRHLRANASDILSTTALVHETW